MTDRIATTAKRIAWGLLVARFREARERVEALLG